MNVVSKASVRLTDCIPAHPSDVFSHGPSISKHAECAAAPQSAPTVTRWSGYRRRRTQGLWITDRGRWCVVWSCSLTASILILDFLKHTWCIVQSGPNCVPWRLLLDLEESGMRTIKNYVTLLMSDFRSTVAPLVSRMSFFVAARVAKAWA